MFIKYSIQFSLYLSVKSEVQQFTKYSQLAWATSFMGVMEFLKTSACDPPFSHIWLTPPQLGSKHPNTGVGVICCIRCWDSALKLLMTWSRFLHIKSFCFSSLSFVSAYELLYIGLLHVRKFHLFTVEMQLLLT